MSAPLAGKIRRQASELQAMFKAFGAVESIFFRGVGPGGYDIYGVKFANGVAEFRILLAATTRPTMSSSGRTATASPVASPPVRRSGASEPRPRPRRSRC
jgi:hypothetical protein